MPEGRLMGGTFMSELAGSDDRPLLLLCSLEPRGPKLSPARRKLVKPPAL